MQQYLEQAAHNEDFHDCIVQQFPTKFYDWKITSLFYSAIHLLKALAASKNINIGSTHQDIEQSCNPDRHGNKMAVSKNAWRDYKAMYRYSHTARYEGITDIETFEKLKKLDYSMCIQHMRKFKQYLKGQGLPIEIKATEK